MSSPPLTSPSTEAELERYQARMSAHAADVADALPDDPHDALVVLIGTLACVASEMDVASRSAVRDATIAAFDAALAAAVPS